MEKDNISAGFAKVTSLSGDAIVRHADGAQSTLQLGDQLSVGDIVATAPNANLEIAITGGGVLHLSKEVADVITLDQSVFDTLSDVQNVSVSSDALNILLANHFDGAHIHHQNGFDSALHLADVLSDADHTSTEIKLGSQDDAHKLNTIDTATIDPALLVTHWHHIDT